MENEVIQEVAVETAKGGPKKWIVALLIAGIGGAVAATVYVVKKVKTIRKGKKQVVETVITEESDE